MKLTQLKIAYKHGIEYYKPGPENPLICTIKLSSDHSTVETILSDADAQRIIDLVQGVVAEATARNVADFVSAIRAVEATKSKPAIEMQ